MEKLRRAAVVMFVLVALVGFVPPEAGAAVSAPSITQKVTVYPPVAANAFGSAIAMDPTRLAVRARTSTGRVVFVYDRQTNGEWLSVATVDAPAGATSYWGTYLAINGGLLAVSDPGVVTGTERHGVVHVYRRTVHGFKEVQTMLPSTNFTSIGGVWLGGRGLLLNYVPYCDAVCSTGSWQLFRLDDAGVFQLAVNSLTDLDPSRGGTAISVGVDIGRFVVGNPGYFDDLSQQAYDNFLTVYGTDRSSVTKLHDEVTPIADPETEVLHVNWYRKVDLSGQSLAHEDCCTTGKKLVILRRHASGYVHDATFAVPRASNGLAVVPGVVLLADTTLKGWRTFVEHDGSWAAGADLAAPGAVAGSFPVEPVAAADRVALSGAGRVFVLTISPNAG